MTLGPVRVMGAGVVVMMCAEEVSVAAHYINIHQSVRFLVSSRA